MQSRVFFIILDQTLTSLKDRFGGKLMKHCKYLNLKVKDNNSHSQTDIERIDLLMKSML